MKFTIAVDVDDVLAQLGVIWLQRYNYDYNDNVQVSDLKDWDISKFVKPECGLKIFNYLDDPTIYDNVPVTEGALEGVMALREMGHKVVFATSTPITTAGRKFYWLRDNGFEPKEKEYMELQDKSLIHANYLFDDRYENCLNFCGIGVLLTRPWNEKYYFKERVNNWSQFVDMIKKETVGWSL